MKHLGVVDWGIGGVSILRALEASLPGASFTYYSDSGFTPYGRLSAHALRERLDVVIKKLARQGVEGIVLACNAASTTLANGATYAVPAVGVIAPAVELLKRRRAKHIGIVGGRRTVLSRVYPRALAGSNIHVIQRIAQPLSAAIERGEFRNAAFERQVERIVSPLKHCDAVLLACTHYPAAYNVFENALPGVAIVDPASYVAASVAKTWTVTPSKGRTRFETSGDARAMRTAIRIAWGAEPRR